MIILWLMVERIEYPKGSQPQLHYEAIGLYLTSQLISVQQRFIQLKDNRSKQIYQKQLYIMI